VEKFQSLADFLGVQDPAKPDLPAQPAPSPKVTAKAFCKEILQTREYREALLRRIVMDELPPAVECMLWDRAHGKTVDKVEVKDTTDPLEELTIEQLEERAMRLLEAARGMRKQDDERSEHSVH
jgi:hypothetical protein